MKGIFSRLRSRSKFKTEVTSTSHLVQEELGHLSHIISAISDWQICHGSLLKLIRENDDEHQISLASPVSVTLFPSVYPEALFTQACQLQTVFNELYMSVAENPEWLKSTLADLIESDELTKGLWNIYERCEKSRAPSSPAMGIFRSDYMLNESADGSIRLKQVEFNTISCAGAIHGSRVAAMHRHFLKTGLYNHMPGNASLMDCIVPPNDNLSSLSSSLASALRHYGNARSNLAKSTCVLFVVQPKNFNIADERPIEHHLWSLEPSVPAYRLEWNENMIIHTTLTEDRCLLYHPPYLPQPIEVAVIYYRAGFETSEYQTVSSGSEVRYRFEISQAIKCPSLLAHLATFKKVQQALSVPGSVEMFLSSDKAKAIRETFVPMFTLDSSESGLEGRTLATSPNLSHRFVLKPSREGGGHNVYRKDIPSFLEGISSSRWNEFVLMEMIEPPTSSNTLMSFKGIHRGPTVCELGILGTCLWEADNSKAGKINTVDNKQAGWSLRTKSASVNEMSVVKGYGCFDSIALKPSKNIPNETPAG